MSRTHATVLVLGLLLIFAVIGFLVVSTLSAFLEEFPTPRDVGGGVATQVQQIINPTPTIYPDRVTVIRDVQALSRLETTQYTVEKVITAEVGQGLFGTLFGDRLLFVAHGEVIAGVDLSKVQAGDILVSPDGNVTLIMPAAEIFVSRLDNDQSYVYDRETGLLTRGDVNLETQARQVAEAEIRRAALEDGILELAESNAEAFLRSLLLSFGFEDVTIIQATPAPGAVPTMTP